MVGDRLARDMQHAMVGGVCAGFARRYDFDVALIRAITLLCAVATMGAVVPVYIVAWVVMPRDDPASVAPPAAAGASTAAPESVSDELRQTTARLVEIARVLADKAREAAEEIAEIARRGPVAAAPPPPPASPPPPPVASAPPAPPVPAS